MNDRQLTSFIKIAETGSFSKAAQESFISVPAIVQQIDRLEEDIGFQLFFRSNQGVTLTEAGKLFYDAALKMRDIYQEVVGKIRNKNCIRIGVASNQCPEFLVNACTAFQAKNPRISVHFVEAPYEQHLELLQQGKIDLTVIAKPKDSYLKELEYLELCKDTCAFGVNAGNALASKKQICKADLRGTKVLCGTYHYMEQSFEKILEGTVARLQTLNAEYNLESRAQAKFSDSLLVFHSKWQNCYSHMFHIIQSEIEAGSIGVVIRNGEEKRFERLIEEMRKEGRA